MRVLVAGATGFVGSAVVRALRADGHEVTGLVRDPAGAGHLATTGAKLHRGDMLDPTSYIPVVADVDAVVHAAQLATPGRLTPRRAQQLFDADGVMTHALAEACLEHGRRLLYTGGCFDWGDHGEEWIDETTPLTPSPMGVGHARQAVYLDQQHRDAGLDVVRLSPGFVYGPLSSSRRAAVGCAASEGAPTGGVACTSRISPAPTSQLSPPPPPARFTRSSTTSRCACAS
ncbi:MAG: NAD-dependent epimerase/dehydratase family protein [Geodermatophilaceae bacterium]